MKGEVPNVEPIMDEALRGLATDLRCEYDMALRNVPHLVTMETSKAKFLRAENNNPWQAARRLALYWKFRRQCMTDERWLRPMTCTGTGCLGEAEVALLRSGIYHYSNATDMGPVVIVDPSRNREFTAEASGRILFYLGTVLDDVQVQTTGITVVYAVTSEDTVSHVNQKFGQYMVEGLPVKIRRFVVVQNFEPVKESLVEYLAVRRKLQIETNYGADCCELIASQTSQHDLLQLVEQARIPSEALPATCGGKFEPHVLCDWLCQRLRVEEGMFGGPGSAMGQPLQWMVPVSSSESTATTTNLSRRRRKRKCAVIAQDTGSDSNKETNKVPKYETLVAEKLHVRDMPVATPPKSHISDKVAPKHERLIDDMLNEVRQAMKKCHGQHHDSLTMVQERSMLTDEEIVLLESFGCRGGDARAGMRRKRMISDEDIQIISPFSGTAVADEDLDFGLPIVDPWGDQ